MQAERLDYVAARLSLKDLAKRLAAPLTEEHAWAILHQLAQSFAKRGDGSSRSCKTAADIARLRPLPGSVRLSLDRVSLSEDGEIHLEELKHKPFARGATTKETEHKKVLRDIGCLLYSLLDYGIPDDQERTLSLQMSNLIEWLISDHESSSESGSVEGNLDDEMYLTNDSGITENEPATLEEGLLYITKACECHVFDVPSPETHYKAICRSLVEEAMAIHKLGEEIETDKRNEKKVAEQKWKKVMEQVKMGVQLQHVPVAEKATRPSVEITMSDFDLLLIQISKYDRSKLKTPSDVEKFSQRRLSLPNGPYKGARYERRATTGDIHSTLMFEIKSHPTLRPASKRTLRPTSLAPRSLSPMETLMEEILTPPALKRVERNSPRRQSLFDKSTRLCKSFSDITDLSSSSPTPLAPFPSAHHLDRIDWERSISQEGSTPSDDDVFGNPTISLSPPVSETSGDNSMEIDDVISSCASSTADSAPLDDKTGKKLKLNLSLKGLRHKREESVVLDISSGSENGACPLTLSEVAQIRRVTAKAELLDLQVHNLKLFWSVWKEKVCSQCHKTRFSCVKRPYTCQVCKRLMCSKCIAKVIDSKKKHYFSKDTWYICQVCWNFTLQFSSANIFDH